MPPASRPAGGLPATTQAVADDRATQARLLATTQADFDAGRHAEDDFIARGLRAAEQARQNGRYVSVHALLQQLTEALAATGPCPPP